MIALNNITIVAVACVRVSETLQAMRKSMSGINFFKAKLFTNEEIIDDKIEIIKIDNLDYEKYNKFIVYELHKHIDTEYCLIVQDDGYVINPDKWSDDFLCDYIGAPWSLPQDDFSSRDPFGNIIRVGNGGFSLRSKKLLSLPTELNMEWKPYFGYYNEDGFFSVHNRHIFEQNGCRYGTLEIASRFSFEQEMPENKEIIPFGFHGKWCKFNNGL